MADTKVSALGAASTLDGTELLYAVQSATGVQTTAGAVRDGAVNPQVGTTYTFVITDSTVSISNGSAQTLTIPPNADVAFPVGKEIEVIRLGAGLPTIAAGAGVTLNLPTGIKPNRFMGALVTKSATQSAANYTTETTLTWNSETYDTDAFHDVGSNTERLTAPQVGYYVVSANVEIQAITVDLYAALRMYKDASFDYAGHTGIVTEAGLGALRLNLTSSPILFAAGEYIETKLIVETDTSIDISAPRSWFSMYATAINPVGSVAFQHGSIILKQVAANVWSIKGDLG